MSFGAGSAERFGAYRVYLIHSLLLAFATSLAWGVNLVYQVDVVGLSPFQLVLVGTALEVTCFLFEVPTGVVADVYSRRLSIIVGTCVLGAGFILMGAVPAFWMLLLSQVVCGIGYTFLSGAEQAWIADEVGEERAAHAFVQGHQAGAVGGIVGIAAAAGLGLIDLALPIVAGGALAILLGVLLVIIMPERGFTPAPRGERSSFASMRGTLSEGATLVRGRPILLTLLAIAVLFGSFNEGWDRLWTAHLLKNVGFPSLGGIEPVLWYGAIGIVSSLLGIAALELLRRRVNLDDHGAVNRALIAINALLAVAVIGYALTGSFWVAAPVLLGATVLREVIYPLKAAWVNQHVESRVRATVLSLNGQADAVGQMAGGPVVGAIGSLVGLRAALSVAGLVLLPGLWLYARALGQDSRATVEETAAAD